MSFDFAGRRSAILTVSRAGLLSLGLMLPLALGACTTVEGTNAMTDVGTFEREVMTSTLQGLSLVPREEKEEGVPLRGPLVLPKDASSLPAPQEDTASAVLPKDSSTVEINTAGLTEDDLRRLRNARVVDLRSLDGRPLTDAETKALTARMVAANKEIIVNEGKRPLYMPPDEYFTNIGGKDAVCKAADGTLVSLKDKRCPQEIRDAFKKAGPKAGVAEGPVLD